MAQKTGRQGQRRGQSIKIPSKRQMTLSSVLRDAEEYEKTDEAIYAVRAALQCLTTGIRFPDVIRRYLIDVLRDIVHLSQVDVPSSDQIDKAIARAMRLKGGPGRNPLGGPRRRAHALIVAAEVYFHKARNWNRQRRGEEGTEDWTSIFKAVAAQHGRSCEDCGGKCSAATVKAFWYKHYLEVIPSRLIAEAKSKTPDGILR